MYSAAARFQVALKTYYTPTGGQSQMLHIQLHSMTHLLPRKSLSASWPTGVPCSSISSILQGGLPCCSSLAWEVLLTPLSIPQYYSASGKDYICSPPQHSHLMAELFNHELFGTRSIFLHILTCTSQQLWAFEAHVLHMLHLITLKQELEGHVFHNLLSEQGLKRSMWKTVKGIQELYHSYTLRFHIFTSDHTAPLPPTHRPMKLKRVQTLSYQNIYLAAGEGPCLPSFTTEGSHSSL